MIDPAAIRWRTSTYSGSHNNCVEIAPVPDRVAIRDTKNRAAGTIAVPRQAWAAFIGSLASR